MPQAGRRSRLKPEAQLNDEQSTRDCIADQGLGFLMLNGDATMDEDHTFLDWHRAFKAKHTTKAAALSNSGRTRRRKAVFTPTSVEAFWLRNTPALDAAITAGQLTVKNQGRQPPKKAGEQGAKRRRKFSMHVPKARHTLQVDQREWKYKDTPSE